jgi:predicted nucleic acid-binding protein
MPQGQIPERELVDNALRRARDIADANNPAGTQNEVLVELGRTLVSCTEAVVRQIRDADDTVASVLAQNLHSDLVDLTTVVGENLGPLTAAIKQVADKAEKKGGLFG